MSRDLLSRRSTCSSVTREDVIPPPDPVALGEQTAAQLVLLMDTDKNGKISKDEYMRFMAAEYNRLDKDRSGEIDVRNCARATRKASPAPVSSGLSALPGTLTALASPETASLSYRSTARRKDDRRSPRTSPAGLPA